MPHCYTTALSHLILAGTGIYCLSVHGINWQSPSFSAISYVLITANSIVGVWRYGNPDYGDDADELYQCTYFLETIFALPCIVTQIWLNHGMVWEGAYAHVGASALPLIAYIADKDKRQVVDLLLSINVLSLGIVAGMNKNYFGVAAAVSFLINYFIIKDEGDVMDIPALDLFNYGMCFFELFSLRAFSEVSPA